MRRVALIGAALLTGAHAEASPVHLDDDDLQVAVAGKTVNIDTPFGVPLSVSYGANGIITGRAGTVLAAYLGSARDRGRWKVQDGRLCQKWFKWLASEETCMRVRQDGLKIYWTTNEGRTGTAMIEPGPPELEGATASGLGAPPPPPEPPASQPAPQAAPAVVRAPAHRPPPPEPRLVEPLREVRLAAAARMPVPRPFAAAATAAAFVPMRPVSLAPAARPDGGDTPGNDSARDRDGVPDRDGDAATAHSMRHAVDIAAIWSLEHRWCLANALAPIALPRAMPPEGAGSAPGEAAVRPSLLEIAVAQVAPDELPLHAPSCITAEPVLNQIAKLPLER